MKKQIGTMVAVLMVACADQAPMDLDRSASVVPQARVDLGSCQKLQVPPGHVLAVRLYAQGVQIYKWSGAAWTFVGPEAVLTADAAGVAKVGSHYGGPTWESQSGGKVVGAVADRCTADPTAVPWLLLNAQAATGPGVFDRVTHIQRINTVGGIAPSHAGGSINEEARVPYTTEYLFYRATGISE